MKAEITRINTIWQMDWCYDRNRLRRPYL